MTTIQDLPYLFWVNMLDLANDAIGGIEFLHAAACGYLYAAFGPVAKQHIIAAMSPPRRVALRAHFAHHHNNWFEARSKRTVQVAESPFVLHCTSECHTCFSFLNIWNIIKNTGWYNDRTSYVARAIMENKRSVVRRYVVEVPPRNFHNPVLLDLVDHLYPHAPAPAMGLSLSNLIEVISNDEQAVRLWLDRYEGDTSLAVTPAAFDAIFHPVYRCYLANWIDVPTAQRFQNHGVRLSKAWNGWSGGKYVTIWHALVVDVNPHINAVCAYLEANQYPATVPSAVSPFGINSLASGGLEGGQLTPWAIAIKIKNQRAVTYMRNSANVDALARSCLVPHHPQSWNGAFIAMANTVRGQRFIGYEAASEMSAFNLSAMRGWVQVFQGQFANPARSGAPGSVQRRENVWLLLMVLEQVLVTCSRERLATSEDPALSARLKASYRRSRLKIGAKMVKFILQNSIRTPLVLFGTPVTLTLHDEPQYAAWLNDVEDLGLEDISSLFALLRRPTRFNTRSGRN